MTSLFPLFSVSAIVWFYDSRSTHKPSFVHESTRSLGAHLVQQHGFAESIELRRQQGLVTFLNHSNPDESGRNELRVKEEQMEI